MSNEPLSALGAYLTAAEAEGLAVLLSAGEHTMHALSAVGAARRGHASELLKAAGISHAAPELSVAVLRGIAGAKSVHRELVPVWTMPGNEATIGHLTNQFRDAVASARTSVTCATYNFSPDIEHVGRTQGGIRGARGRGVRVCRQRSGRSSRR